jgi:hypothetical protein
MSESVTELGTLNEIEYSPDGHEVVCEFCGEIDGDGSLEAYCDHMAEVHSMSRSAIEAAVRGGDNVGRSE